MTLKYAASENSELGQQRDYTITFFFFTPVNLVGVKNGQLRDALCDKTTSVFLQV